MIDMLTITKDLDLQVRFFAITYCCVRLLDFVMAQYLALTA